MKQVYHAVPCEDGGWKIIVQTIPQTESLEEEGPVRLIRYVSESGTFLREAPSHES